MVEDVVATWPKVGLVIYRLLARPRVTPASGGGWEGLSDERGECWQSSALLGRLYPSLTWARAVEPLRGGGGLYRESRPGGGGVPGALIDRPGSASLTSKSSTQRPWPPPRQACKERMAGDGRDSSTCGEASTFEVSRGGGFGRLDVGATNWPKDDGDIGNPGRADQKGRETWDLWYPRWHRSDSLRDAEEDVRDGDGTSCTETSGERALKVKMGAGIGLGKTPTPKPVRRRAALDLGEEGARSGDTMEIECDGKTVVMGEGRLSSVRRPRLDRGRGWGRLSRQRGTSLDHESRSSEAATQVAEVSKRWSGPGHAPDRGHARPGRRVALATAGCCNRHQMKPGPTTVNALSTFVDTAEEATGRGRGRRESRTTGRLASAPSRRAEVERLRCLPIGLDRVPP